MDTIKKMEIAQALCREIGMEGRQKIDKHHFDQGTGTLYIGSHVYETGDIEASRDYMSRMKDEMDKKKDAAAAYYEVANIAIRTMLDNNLLSGGKLVVNYNIPPKEDKRGLE